MIEHLRILTAKEVRTLIEELNEHFDSKFSTDKAMVENNKRKIFLINKDCGRIDEKKLRINNLGLYFCTREKDGFRLSLEGSQMINPQKNFYSVTKEMAAKWIAGENIEANEPLDGYVIIKYKYDAIGCGKFKEGIILNAVSKERRIQAVVINN